MRSFLLYSEHSWREVRVNGNVCVEEQLLFASGKEVQRVYCVVKEESESPQSRNFR